LATDSVYVGAQGFLSGEGDHVSNQRVTVLGALAVVLALLALPELASGQTPDCDPGAPSAIKFKGLPGQLVIGRTEYFSVVRDSTASAVPDSTVHIRMADPGGQPFFEDDFKLGEEAYLLLVLGAEKAAVITASTVEHAAGQPDCMRRIESRVRALVRIYFPSRCSNRAYKPRSVIVACGDGNFQLRKMRWRGWNRGVVRGRGLGLANDCSPYCAVGHFHRVPIRVKLYRRKRCSNIERYVYTAMRWRFVGHLPTGFRRTGSTPFPCSIYDL
jgi:hypothetical protein